MRRLRPRFRQHGSGDAGHAVVEFLGVTVVLLVPIVYLVLVLGRLQAAAFAVESGAVHASRVLARTADEPVGLAAAAAGVQLALADQGFDAAAAGDALAVECSADPCRTPGATIAVTVEVTVPLPLVPSFVRDVVPLAVPVSTTHLVAVDQFAGEG